MAYKIITHYPDHPEDDELASMCFRTKVLLSVRYDIDNIEEAALYAVFVRLIAKKLSDCFYDSEKGNQAEVETSHSGSLTNSLVTIDTGDVYEGNWSTSLEGRMLEHFDDDGELVMREGAEHHIWESIWNGEVVPMYRMACEATGIDRPLSYRNVSLVLAECDIFQN